MNSKNRAKKRFTSNVNVVDLHDYNNTSNPRKKQKVTLLPRNRHQEIYLNQLEDQDRNIVMAIGPAGTGKTIMAVMHGIKQLQMGKVEKIIVTRPAVSVDEDLGALPGTLEQKMAPWTRPIFDVLNEYYDQKTIEHMIEEQIIEISPLAYMRGRTFKNAYIIADEMQNATQNQMKMLLTRLGENSNMAVTGDLAQADRLRDNGLIDFIDKLKNKDCRHVSVVEFDHKDIERHNAVKEILQIYGDD